MLGDTNNDGFFGEYSSDDYYKFFRNNYNKSEYSYANTYSDPIVELYLDKIIKVFKPPLPPYQGGGMWGYSYQGGMIPP